MKPIAVQIARSCSIGPTGIGKTWLARAFGQTACRDGYTKASELFRNLATARADGSHRKLLYQLSRIDLLIVDDWAMALLSDPERWDFLEISDQHYQARSTLLTSQLPVAAWHAQIGDPTVANSILDRLVHNAHHVELRRESRCGRSAGARVHEPSVPGFRSAERGKGTRTPPPCPHPHPPLGGGRESQDAGFP